jgi:peptide/nickel transport system permease protein
MERIKQFLHEPGGYRIVAGTLLVFILMAATVFGTWVSSRSADSMDIHAQLQPPTVGWIRALLTSQEGLHLWEQRQAGNKSPDPAQDTGMGADDEFDFLRGDAEANETKTESGTESGLLGSHFLGTDKDGHDMFALLVAGARNCLLPGLVTCAVALGLGVPLGLLAGYYGGRPRRLVQAISGTLLSMPRLVLILVVVCALEPNVYYTMAVLGLTLMPRVAELLMTRVRLLANQGFILAAKEGGLSDWRILTRHLFWYQNRQVFSIQFSLIMAESVLTETTLSYLQFGTKPPEVSWGNIIEGSQMTFFSGYYWITFFPALAIILAILGFFYVGDGMNARLTFKEGK